MNHEIRGGFGPEFQSDVFARSLKPSEIEKEIFFPPGTEVFRDLVGLTGNGKPARSIVRRVGTEAIKRIIFLGPPGNGKTTVLNQCSRTLEANLGNSPISHYYDDKLTGDRSYDDTYQFNKNLFNSIKSGERLNPGRISLVELVGVGDIKVKDRGLTALNMFAADSNDSNNNTFFVVLVGNSAIELRASYIREFVRGLKQQPELVIPLLNEHRIDPVGFGSGAKGGRKI